MGFCGVAGLIVCGLVGDQGYLGAKVLLSQGGFAPQGYWPIVLTMVIILVNFQGTEIIGLAAGECKDPAKKHSYCGSQCFLACHCFIYHSYYITAVHYAVG